MPMTRFSLISAGLLLTLAACGSPQYVAPSRAISEDIAASHWSGASDLSTNTARLLDFRDNDIDQR